MALCLFGLGMGLSARNMQRSIAAGVIRVHVVAHSDSDDDQWEKLSVRDGVLACLENILAGVDTVEEARARVGENLLAIEAAAGERTDKPVSATLGPRTLPETTYGDYVFPPGEYEALTVTIGAGEGRNFWCVAFPPLCLFENSVVTTDPATLQKYFSEEELKALQPGEVKVKLGWKLWEWWEELFENR